MKFGYVIVYTADVAGAIQFYKDAFGFETRFFSENEEGGYGELESGGTILAFASHKLAESNLTQGYTKLSDLEAPAGIEIGLVTDDVPGSMERAIECGAALVSEAKTKSWGQTVGYVRAPEGTLIEVCTPIGG